jgi:ribonuclease BN (tRNA processing enzyme)
MEPKIIFLGTGGDIYTVGKQLLGSGGIILQVDDMQFHIDPGPGALLAAHQSGVNPRENTAILVSHCHLNHCNDVNAVIDAMTNSGTDVTGVVVANRTVVNGNDDTLPAITNFHKKCVEKVMVLDAGQRVGINEVEVRAISAKHTDASTIGFKFLTSKFVFTYTSDTGYDEAALHDYKESDVLILNVVNPTGIHSETQLSTDDAVKIINAVKPKMAIITHFGIKMLNADIINEAREIQKQTLVHVVAAKDGMIINPLTHSAAYMK